MRTATHVVNKFPQQRLGFKLPYERNLIFDEASSWWAPELKQALADEKSFKEGSKEEISQVQQTPIEGEEENNEDDEDSQGHKVLGKVEFIIKSHNYEDQPD
ncbi:unnamed protein product [Citrullus colocynthis]|uniref:Uncharacterized protein n=1 Tax=Citrullus colocynthis TaxID=252529 RepID=A0ABP0Y3V7_9ROSI